MSEKLKIGVSGARAGNNSYVAEEIIDAFESSETESQSAPEGKISWANLLRLS